MSTDVILELVLAFFQDLKVYTIMGLIGLDLVLGIAGALKAGVFSWSKVAQFYQTNIVPYILGYLALYVGFQAVPGLEDLVGQGLATVAFGTIVASLLGSIAENLKALGLGKK